MRPRPIGNSAAARAVVVLAVWLLLPAPSRASSPWSLSVDATPLPDARAQVRGGVLVVDLAAVAPHVGLVLTRDGDGVRVTSGGAVWTASAGASFFDSDARQVFLERPLAVEGAAVVVPADAVALMSGYFLALEPDARRATLVAPTARPARAFTVPKSDEELAAMAAADAAADIDGRAPDAALSAPPSDGTLHLRAGLGYVPSRDGALSLGADGDVYGMSLGLDGVMTLGDRGFELLTGRLVLADEVAGWLLAGGDLPSRIWGVARGVRAAYRVVDGWQPTLSLYLPWRLGPNP